MIWGMERIYLQFVADIAEHLWLVLRGAMPEINLQAAADKARALEEFMEEHNQ